MIKYILIALMGIYAYFFIVSLKFRNPYKLVMIFGKKGSGKNTLLTKLSVKYNKLGYHVFSDSQIFNTYQLSTDWIGHFDFPENSVIMIEEAGINWSNRDFKTFPKEVVKFFKLQRHQKIIVYLASQSFDVDKKLRDLCDEMYLCTNWMGIFSVAKKINKRIAIHNASDDNNGESFLTETYSFDFPWRWKWTYIPRWIPFFNSFHVEKYGKQVERRRYIFNDERKLWKETSWKYYKIHQILDFVEDKAETLQMEMAGFVVDSNLHNLILVNAGFLSPEGRSRPKFH